MLVPPKIKVGQTVRLASKPRSKVHMVVSKLTEHEGVPHAHCYWHVTAGDVHQGIIPTIILEVVK